MELCHGSISVAGDRRFLTACNVMGLEMVCALGYGSAYDLFHV